MVECFSPFSGVVDGDGFKTGGRTCASQSTLPPTLRPPHVRTRVGSASRCRCVAGPLGQQEVTLTEPAGRAFLCAQQTS